MPEFNCPRIAIVEDDLDLRQSMEEGLLAEGYKVWSAGSAEAFYKQLLLAPVDVVILDIGLPGENGLSVVLHLQTIPNLAVIILSGRVAVEDRLTGLRNGANRYLVKPINLDELVANIEAVTRQSQMALPEKMQLPSWQLGSSDWLLIAPDLKSMKLTSSEFILIQILVNAQGETVSKDIIADRLFGNHAINSGERIAVLLSRLKSKADAKLGQSVPIKNVHLVGYAFTEPAALK